MRIDHPKDTEIPGLRKLWKQAFGDTDAFLDLFFASAFDPQRCLRAAEGETVAAALYWLDGTCRGRRVAYIYAVATDQRFRGRGLCRALMGHAHGLLKAAGYAGAVLVPGDAGLFIMYGKMGYRVCSSVNEWTVPAGKTPLALKALTAEEFAARRRERLPAGGVVQEGPVLEMLAGMGRFYAGEGVLLAAIREKDTLWVPELLGDAGKAPGIVAALGASRGKFRGPGRSRDFAMYHGFDGSPPPTYLGFALD